MLFSIVKLKLGPNFSFFIHRFKIEIFEFFPIQKEIFRFLNLSIFPNSWKRLKTGLYEFKPMFYFQIFSKFTKVGKLELLKSPWFHILINCEDSLSGTVCLYERERVAQFMVKLPVFKEKNAHIIIILCQFEWE